MFRGATPSWTHCAGSRGETVLKNVGEANRALVEKLVGPMAPLVGRRSGCRHVQCPRHLVGELSTDLVRLLSLLLRPHSEQRRRGVRLFNDTTMGRILKSNASGSESIAPSCGPGKVFVPRKCDVSRRTGARHRVPARTPRLRTAGRATSLEEPGHEDFTPATQTFINHQTANAGLSRRTPIDSSRQAWMRL